MTEREQLEQALAALEAQRTILGDAVVDASIAALHDKLAALEPAPTAEQRKQVSVLFADVSGFTAMSETMDAEDVTEIMNALWERLDKAITDHGGRIDKHMGDSVMAIWGAEMAREDDPERAIRAALAMQKEVRSWNSEVGETSSFQPFDRAQGRPPISNLQIRIGINTGPVLLGEVGTTGEYTAVGDTVNTASRLEQAAPVGGILISHDTYRHVRGVFIVQLLEPIRVKGKAEPLQVYLVERAKPRAFRMGWRGVEGVETCMIGREGELKRLQDALYTAMEDGERQTVTISGAAGVGKSRLLYEFENWMDLLPQDVFYFKGRASHEMQNVPYALIRDLFAFRFQIQDSDRAQAVREKMERGIGEALGETRPEPSRRDEQGQMRAHFIGQLLGFDFSDSPHLHGVLDDAQQLRDRALMYLSDYFKAMAAQLPTVILLEDVHWADDSSLDVLNHLALTTSSQRLLFVCLARPTLFERRPHWGEGQTFHAQLELRPLSKRDSRRLVEEILQRVEQVPVALRELVVSGAEGNPFYVEELIKMLIEDSVIITQAERWQVEPIRLTTVRVPATLTGVLQARLDSLPAAERTTVQQASVVGRTFWDSAVARIGQSAGGAAGQEVPAALSALRGKEMIFQRETSAFAETREYIFKHAILREVTYESVLKRLRRVYHGLVADWLMEQGGERAGEYTGLIAEHLELAGQREKAVTYLRRAGEQAAAAFANAEAVAYLTRALNLTPETGYAERYALLLAREKVYDLQGEREAQRRDLAALGQLAQALDSGERRAEVALRQANYAFVTGDHPAAIIAAAQQAIALAQEAGVVESEAAGYLAWGRGLFRQGDDAAASVQLEEALRLAQAAGLRRVEADSLSHFSHIVGSLGDLARARDYSEQALALYREVGDRRGEAPVLVGLGATADQQGDYAGAQGYFEQSLALVREIGDRRGESSALINLGGGVFLYTGDFAGARDYLEQALALVREIGDRRREAFALGALGWVFLCTGDYAGAQAYSEQALAFLREMGARQSETITLTNLGAISLSTGDFAGARDYLEQGLSLRRQIGCLWTKNEALAWRGLLCHHLGDDEAALENCQQALGIARDVRVRFRWGQGLALTVLGHALVGLERLEEAAAAYRDAQDLGQELGHLSMAMEALAGLARASLAQGDLAQAQAQVEEILSYLETNTLEGAAEPFRVYLTCYRVLKANQHPRAQEILTTAYNLLQEHAGNTTDEEMHRSFLENVPAHRELVREWAKGA